MKKLGGKLYRATAQAQHEVQDRLLLDVVLRERAAVIELLAGEDQALMVRGVALLVLDLFFSQLGFCPKIQPPQNGLQTILVLLARGYQRSQQSAGLNFKIALYFYVGVINASFILKSTNTKQQKMLCINYNVSIIFFFGL